MLAIFGVGTDNVTPYVGFVTDMPFDAASNVPLEPVLVSFNVFHQVTVVLFS